MSVAPEPLVFEIQSIHGNIEAILNEYKIFLGNTKVTYFLSYGWIRTWLKLVPQSSELYYIEGKQKGKTVIAFFAGMRKIKRRKIFTAKQLCLNISGQDDLDNLCIEYNRFLYCEKTQLELQQLLKTIPLKWEEIMLPALDSTFIPATELCALQPPFYYVEDRRTLSRYVDLNKVRSANGDYLSLISSNTRAQIRKSEKLLKEIGPLSIHCPDTLTDALHIFDELAALHQRTWTKRHEAGAFASPLFQQFHQELIRDRFSCGEIQLIKVSVSKETLGCLYNFVINGIVYFYQSGLNYSFGEKIQPGLVCHMLAITFNANLGADVYDFLADDCRYKKSLATDANPLIWGRIQRRSAKLMTENFLHFLVTKIRKLKL